MNRLFISFFILFPNLLFSQGSILLMGGGSDTRAWADDPFSWFVVKADSGIIINIDADEVATSYAETFKGHGADQASTSLRIPTRTAANDSATYKILTSARGIWMEGGDQYDYVSNWKGTMVEEAIRVVFESGGVVGGTSAGCAVLGEIVFDAKYGGLAPRDAAYNPYHSDVHLEEDLWMFLPDVLTDSHFHSRGRLGRLIPLWAKRVQDHGNENLLGIGVGDQTALCIENDGTAICYGNASVTFIWGTDQTSVQCSPGHPVKAKNVRIDQIFHGSSWNINSRSLAEAGPGLIQVDPGKFKSPSRKIILDGKIESLIDSGQVRVGRLTGNQLNAWKGNLSVSDGDGPATGWAIIPAIWSNRDTYENRWVGGFASFVHSPGINVLYLDDNSEVLLGAQKRIKVNRGVAYILQGSALSHAGKPVHRSTNYSGWIGGILHFIAEGDDLMLSGQSHTSEFKKSSVTPESLRLFPLFPNPFNEQTQIRFSTQFGGDILLDVFNQLGRKTKTRRYIAKPGLNTCYLKADGLTTGIYYVVLRQGAESHVRSCLYLK